MSFLLEAAKASHWQRVEQLLVQGENINQVDRQGNSVLLYAVAQGNVEAVQLVVAAGGHLNYARPPQGLTPLMLAAASGQGEIAQILIQAGARVQQGNEDNSTALMIAVYRGDRLLVRQLIAAGAQVNHQDQAGDTPLFLAWQGNHRQILTDLLAAGADPNQEELLTLVVQRGDFESLQQLHAAGACLTLEGWLTAASENQLACLNFFIAQGQNLDQRDENGETALHLACLEGHKEIVNRLLAAGAEINLPSHWRDTPLLIAVGQGDLEIVQLLLAAGADVHQGVEGETPLLVCYTSTADCPGELITLLLQAGANPDSCLPDGTPLLIAAVQQGRYQWVERLLEAGANVNICDQNRATALMWASVRGHGTILARLLLVPGLALEAQNQGGETALSLAQLQGYRNVAALLCQAGATK